MSSSSRFSDPFFAVINQMDFIMFRKLFTFKGRANRRENFSAFFVLFLFSIIGQNNSEDILFFVIFIVLYWVFIVHAVKRAHDIGLRGWFVLIPFFYLFLLFLKGEEKDNRFGPVPGKNDVSAGGEETVPAGLGGTVSD